MWSLNGNQTQLRTELLVATLDLLCPSKGLADLRVGSRPAMLESVPTARILQVFPGACRDKQQQVVDSYVRGDDLVVHYAPATAADVTPEICWRVQRPGDVASIGLELIVSVHTSGRDSDPSYSLESLLPTEDVVWLDGRGQQDFARLPLDYQTQLSATPEDSTGAVLFRLPGRSVSYVEMVHPSDFCQIAVTIEEPSVPLARSSFRIFAEKIEKGVIRRGRFRGYFLPREDDESVAIALHRQFAASDPPLSA